MKLKKISILVGMLAILAIIPTAQASAWDGIKEVGGNLWNKAKEKGSEVVDTVRENGPGWIDNAKEKGGELLDKAGDAIQGAQEKFSEWNQAQQDEFWERTESMVNGSSQSQPADPAATTPPASVPSEAPTTQPSVPVSTPSPTAPTTSDTETFLPTIMFYNGHWYREVQVGGELYFNDKMFVRDDSLGDEEPTKITTGDTEFSLTLPQTVAAIAVMVIVLVIVVNLMFHWQCRKKR